MRKPILFVVIFHSLMFLEVHQRPILHTYASLLSPAYYFQLANVKRFEVMVSISAYLDGDNRDQCQKGHQMKNENRHRLK